MTKTATAFAKEQQDRFFDDIQDDAGMHGEVAVSGEDREETEYFGVKSAYERATGNQAIRKLRSFTKSKDIQLADML